ncbi:MAG: DUF262 domain-containing protein [Desulfobacteraceae bacterium]
MTVGSRTIQTRQMNIRTFVHKLTEAEFLIPSFQREFVWRPEDIIRLWDSLYRFYPIGSILYWKTSIRLHIHRELGGWILSDHHQAVKERKEWVYILDGQQRATSLLVSLFGLKTRGEGQKAWGDALFFDATTATFFFEKALNRRRREVNDAFLIRLGDALDTAPDQDEGLESEPGYLPFIKDNLRQLHRVFTDYNLSLIRLQGYDIPAVREIFERINQEGKELTSMDLMIARTFQDYAYLVEDDL